MKALRKQLVSLRYGHRWLFFIALEAEFLTCNWSSCVAPETGIELSCYNVMILVGMLEIRA